MSEGVTKGCPDNLNCFRPFLGLGLPLQPLLIPPLPNEKQAASGTQPNPQPKY